MEINISMDLGFVAKENVMYNNCLLKSDAWVKCNDGQSNKK